MTALSLIKKIAGHEARLATIKAEIVAQFGTNPPDNIAWRINKIELAMPRKVERAVSEQIRLLITEVETLLLFADAVRGGQSRSGASAGGKLRRDSKRKTAGLDDRDAKIVKQRGNGELLKTIAARHGICSRTVSAILKKQKTEV